MHHGQFGIDANMDATCMYIRTDANSHAICLDYHAWPYTRKHLQAETPARNPQVEQASGQSTLVHSSIDSANPDLRAYFHSRSEKPLQPL